MKIKTKQIIIAVIGLIILFIIGKFIFTPKANARIEIETEIASLGTIENIVTATGTIQPIKQVEVGTQVSGVVQKIYVDFNSKVKKGQLIAELDKTNLRASLSVAKSNYNSALNELQYVSKTYDRQKALFDKKVISQADFDEANFKLINAQNTLSQRKSDLEKAQTNLNYADIISPIDGAILSRTVDVGQTVAASFNTPTLFTIAQDLTKMQVEANVDEADIGKVKLGQKVLFTVDAFQNETFNGTVSQIRLNPTVTSNVVTYTVIIEANNPDLKLMPGLTAIVTIYTLEIKNILTIPQKALEFVPSKDLIDAYTIQNNLEPYTVSPTDEKNIVWVVKDKKLEPRKIKTGAKNDIYIQVISGISPKEEIVLDLKEVTVESNATNTGSPFMPKRPNQNKKK